MNIGGYGYGNAYSYLGSAQSFLGNTSAAPVGSAKGTDQISPFDKSPAAREAKRTGKVECQTCKERKYQDGSDEMVSFKSASHISPESAGSRVRAHEQEHVNNAYKKAATDNGKVLQASVSLKTAICPECGRSYVAGGVTNTKIRYNEDNPYGKNAKSFQAEATKGNNVDLAV